MRRLYFLFIALLSISAAAQTTQSGYVQEYNEKAKKTPLSGVELRVRSANSTVSDEAGQFSLQFLTLKPGEKVNVRRIEKLGYEIFNKEAVEQWNINPQNPFIIVMCRSDKFKAIRDNYEKVSSASYARQLEKEQAELKALKTQGKIKEAEYQKQLAEIQENYDKQLDNLGNYIDRFARIDLSELSAVEQEIIELVQQGRIEQAIAKYEQQNYLDKYKQEVAQLKEVSTAIDQLTEIKTSKEQSRDSILAAIDRQIETLRLAGGKENFDKIGVILHDIAYADSTNISLIVKYYEHCISQKSYKSAINCLKTIIAVRDEQGVDDYSNAKRVVARRNLGNVYLDIHDYKNAEKYYTESINLCNDSIWNNKEIPSTLIQYSEYELGRLYNETRNFDKAEELLNKDLARRIQKFEKEKTEKNLFELALCYNTIGSFHVNIQQFEKAYSHKIKSFNIINQLEQEYRTDYSDTKANIASDLGATCYYLNDIDGSINYMTQAYEYRLEQAKNNPDKYLQNIAESQGNLGNLYSLTKDFSKSHNFYTLSYNNFKLLYEKDPNSYERPFMMSQYNLATSYKEINDYNKALNLIIDTKKIAEKLFSSNPNAYIKFYTETLNFCGICHHNQAQYKDEYEILTLARNTIYPYYTSEPEVYASTILDINTELGLCLKALSNHSLAEDYFKEAILIGNDIELNNKSSFIENRFSPWHGYINLLYDQHQYDNVIKYAQEVIEKFDGYNPPHFQDIYINLINSYIKTDQLNKAKTIHNLASKKIQDFPQFIDLQKSLL